MVRILGSIIGNGEKAREYYTLIIIEAEKYGIAEVEKVFPSMVANALENMMLLSLSYEEFFMWESKQRTIQPGDDALRTLPPFIKEQQQKGFSWSEMLMEIATRSYSRSDPSEDRGEYARAASTFHLLLTNRKMMRLSRERWAYITFEFGALRLRVANDALFKIEQSNQFHDPEEFNLLFRMQLI